MKKIVVVFLIVSVLFSCGNKQKQTSVEPSGAHPEWAYEAVIYEVNTR
ncbi:hypothetical protein [Limibacterium fermenti]